MNLAEKISLLTSEYTQDDIGQWSETVTKTDVFAIVSSITMSEFYQAGMQGMKPEYRMTVWMTEYKGQENLEYNGNTCINRIYREHMHVLNTELYFVTHVFISFIVLLNK